jgi:hypothetical protein
MTGAGQMSQNPPDAEKKEMKKAQRAYWYSHVTSPVTLKGCKQGRADLKYALACAGIK